MRENFITTEFLSVDQMIEEAKSISKDWKFGKSLFCIEENVSSEREYKEICKAQKRITRHAAIGYNSVKETCDAMKWLHQELCSLGMKLDRVGILLDVAMGLPSDIRGKAMIGTGLMLHSDEEWNMVGQAAPFLIHFGDNMIGALNSIENLKLAFMAGATSAGNLSQYFSYDYPFKYDMNKRTLDACVAICIMGLKKDAGMVLHSNLDDGFAATFHDLATVLGWAKIEKYLAEELMGAKLAHCFGNLFSSPILRITFSEALDAINGGDSCGTMIYGNTTDYSTDFTRNKSVLNGYLIGDIIGQMHNPTGHSITAIPVSEAVRIPRKEEILEAQIMSHEIEKYAREMESYIDWEKIEQDKKMLLVGANKVFDNIITGLDEMGIDIKNPAEIMVTCKMMGPADLERRFGAGELSDDYGHGRKPIYATDMIKRLEQIRERCLANIDVNCSDLSGIRVVLCATDIHEFGKTIVGNVLKKVNAEVYDIGTDVSPDEVIEMALEIDSKILLVSSYNGVAKTFAKALLKKMDELDCKADIFMGGLLTENEEGGNIPVDVTQELIELGIHCIKSAENLPAEIKKLKR